LAIVGKSARFGAEIERKRLLATFGSLGWITPSSWRGGAILAVGLCQSCANLGRKWSRPTGSREKRRLKLDFARPAGHRAILAAERISLNSSG